MWLLWDDDDRGQKMKAVYGTLGTAVKSQTSVVDSVGFFQDIKQTSEIMHCK